MIPKEKTLLDRLMDAEDSTEEKMEPCAGESLLIRGIMKRIGSVSNVPDSPSPSGLVNLCLSGIVESRSGPIGLFKPPIKKLPTIWELIYRGGSHRGMKSLEEAYSNAAAHYSSHGSNAPPCVIFSMGGNLFAYHRLGAIPVMNTAQCRDMGIPVGCVLAINFPNKAQMAVHPFWSTDLRLGRNAE